MRKFRILLAAALIAVSGCAGTDRGSDEKAPAAVSESAAAAPAPEQAEKTEEEYVSRSKLLKCSFFDSEGFTLWDSAAEEYPSDRKIMCGVVPHHLTAGRLISGFFKAAASSRDDVETVVIVATSHYGGDKFITTLSGWDSPFGAVDTNTEIAEAFRDKLGAVCDDRKTEADHSVSSHIPFVKKYFPDADTACLLVAPNSVSEVPEKIAKTLAELPDADKCLFLFSIDFSHYLTPQQADVADRITSRAVRERDLDKIALFGNGNVDSPVCLGSYVRLSDLLGLDIAEADNSNTERVSEIPYSAEAYPEGVTSYFIFITY